MFDISPCSMFSSTFQSISVLAWDFPESSTGEEVGLPYSLKLLPWKVIAHSHVRDQCGPLGPMTNRAAVLRCVSGVFFHKAFYKSVTALCLPFPPCTHALLSQQAPKELLRNAEPTHKLALLATLVILFSLFLPLFCPAFPRLCWITQTALGGESRKGGACLGPEANYGALEQG